MGSRVGYHGCPTVRIPKPPGPQGTLGPHGTPGNPGVRELLDGIELLRPANNRPGRGLQGGEGEGSPPLGGRRSEAQGVAGEAQRHRARRLHAMRPEASADSRGVPESMCDVC